MELKFILESLLFNAQKPLTPRELRDVLAGAAEQSEEASVKAFRKVKEEELAGVLEELERDFVRIERSFRLVCVAGAWQFVSRTEHAPWLRALMGEKPRPPRLSQPALETLAIVAYRQPLTRAEMEQIRGVSVDGVIQTLLERGLIQQVGRAEVPGRPMTYGTTPLFLEYFGLRNLEDLPAADELRRIPIKRPESLLTVEPGLATAPPEALAGQPAAVSPKAPEEAAQAPDAASGAPNSVPGNETPAGAADAAGVAVETPAAAVEGPGAAETVAGGTAPETAPDANTQETRTNP